MTLDWLERIAPKDGCFELFIKHSGASNLVHQVGYFDPKHIEQLVDVAHECSPEPESVFYRINPISIDALQRSPNRVGPVTKIEVGSNTDVMARNLFLVDVDPCRPSNSPANKFEKQAAWRVTKKIKYYFRELGWSEPAIMDSGNGFQILVKIDLPASDRGLVSRVLHALADKFDNPGAVIDTQVGDAARLARLPGSRNCKGRSSDDRPHRLCRSLSLPAGEWLSVPRKSLEEVAAESPFHAVFDQPVQPEVREVISNAHKYVSKMPPAISGKRGHDQLFKAACRLVIGFDLAPDEAMPVLQEYNNRCQPPWEVEDLRRKLAQADAVAMRRGQRRGNLRTGRAKPSSTYEGWEPLPGPEFIGSIPDFGHAGAREVLGRLKEFTPIHWSGWFDYFSMWALQCSDPFVSDLFLRQLYWGAEYPRNWRRELRRWRWQELLEPGLCSRETCLHFASGIRHRHFPIFVNGSGFLADTVNWLAEETGEYPDVYASSNRAKVDLSANDPYPPNNIFFPTYKREVAKQFRRAQKSGEIVAVYWPAILLGASPRVGWNSLQQRLLIAVVRELTRDKHNPRFAEVITGSQVAPAGNGSHTVTCPLLDPDQQYVVFGGNGRRAGRGYQLIGRSFRGWAWRAGYPFKDEEDDARFIFSTGWWFLHHLARLAEDLHLVVGGYHPAHPIHKWRDISALLNCLRTDSGYEWLTECSIRIFAPADFLIRWRYYFSRKLQFRWIPNSADDVGPIAQPVDDDDLRTGDDVRRWLREVGRTQGWLAEVLGLMRKCRVSRQRVNRLVNGRLRDSELMDHVNAIKEVLTEKAGATS